MSFAKSPCSKEVTAIQPHPGLKAPFDYGTHSTAIPLVYQTKNMRKARRSFNLRLYINNAPNNANSPSTIARA